jgi:hypothetical protein
MAVRESRFVAVALLCALCGVPGVNAGGPPSRPQEAIEFPRLFDRYLHADADQAVRVFGSWDRRRIEREARVPRSGWRRVAARGAGPASH